MIDDLIIPITGTDALRHKFPEADVIIIWPNFDVEMYDYAHDIIREESSALYEWNENWFDDDDNKYCNTRFDLNEEIAEIIGARWVLIYEY